MKLRDRADENFIASFQKLADHCPRGESRWFGGAFAFVTQLPARLFNGCVVVGQVDDADFEDGLDWLKGTTPLYSVFLAESLLASLGEIAVRHSLVRDPQPYPGMTLHPVPVPPSPSAGVAIEVMGNDLVDYLRVCDEMGIPRTVTDDLYRPSFVADPDVQLFLARLDGQPVGKALAIRSENASGVYDVSTLKSARNRGVGSALTWAAAAQGSTWGLDTIVLQSSAMGFPMYSRMGFQVVAPYLTFDSPG